MGVRGDPSRTRSIPSSRWTRPPTCPRTTSPSRPSGSRPTSTRGRAEGGGDRGRPAELRDRFGPLLNRCATPRRRGAPARREDPPPRAARGAQRPRAADVRPSTPVPPHASSSSSGSTGAGSAPCGSTCWRRRSPGGLAGHLPGPHPAPRGVPRSDRGTPMTRARLAFVGPPLAGRSAPARRRQVPCPRCRRGAAASWCAPERRRRSRTAKPSSTASWRWSTTTSS